MPKTYQKLEDDYMDAQRLIARIKYIIDQYRLYGNGSKTTVVKDIESILTGE